MPAHLLPVPTDWARGVTWVWLWSPARLADGSLILKQRGAWSRDPGDFGAGFWVLVSGQQLWSVPQFPHV